QQGWVALLRERLQNEKYNYAIINASISGDTTSNGLARLPIALQKYQPTITIIELGGNDGLRGLDISIIKNNLEQMIELIKNAHSKILILGMQLPPNYGPLYTQQFQQIFTNLAKRKDVHIVPFFLQAIAENRDYFQADGIHPTAAAQPLILNTIWPLLKPLL
ncbi:MAG: arylesterase, partial [Gammaproteobacteria bacterium]|nr:arylesterase [Gammaproteobacteria bacterium]